MTKEQRDLYKGTLHCRTCNYDVPIGKTDPKRIHSDYSISKCKVCEWISIHREEIEKAKDSINISDCEILQYLHLIFWGNSMYLNDIGLIMNKTLQEMIDIYSYLHVANKKVRIKFNCEYCGEESSEPLKAYMSSKYHYCSHECYYLDKSNKTLKGEDSPYYNRIDTNCSNCNKSMKIIPSKKQMFNLFGDSHNFCSQKCYWEFRSKYYIGDKVPSYQREKTPEEIEKHRINLLVRLQNDDRLNTSIQQKVDFVLEKNNIEFNREKLFDYYSVDNYLVETNGIIEVMGDYWHTSPIRYNENGYKINKTQQKQLHRDKVKYSYIVNHYSKKILYLWESDINNNIELCEQLITQYIKNNCVLDNYHSFNWDYKDNKLVLKDNLITPYQDLSVNQYRHLIK